MWFVGLRHGYWAILAALFINAVFLLCSPGLVFSRASFFAGKTITVIQDRDPGGTGDMRVRILQETFRNTYQDPEFHKTYKKFTADEPTPLLPEDHEKAIKEIPRDREVIEIFKQLIGAGPLPPRS